ncbi:MAG: hypothetical protein IT378_14340 [Sandaracinaceae bacterium]|nr:hypothetical protein [Sandaracinaceae bacterium]
MVRKQTTHRASGPATLALRSCRRRRSKPARSTSRSSRSTRRRSSCSPRKRRSSSPTTPSPRGSSSASSASWTRRRRRRRSSISCAAARSRTSSPQRKWLERIAAQLKVKVVVDKAALDGGQFAQHGGLKRLNKVFDGKLEAILGDLAEDVWEGV